MTAMIDGAFLIVCKAQVNSLHDCRLRAALISKVRIGLPTVLKNGNN
jgi:hypothetical protein